MQTENKSKIPDPSLTLVVYEYPAALPDIYRWAADFKFRLESGLHDSYTTYNKDKNEQIHIVTTTHIRTVRVPYDKLVVYGRIDQETLQSIPLSHVDTHDLVVGAIQNIVKGTKDLQEVLLDRSEYIRLLTWLGTHFDHIAPYQHLPLFADICMTVSGESPDTLLYNWKQLCFNVPT